MKDKFISLLEKLSIQPFWVKVSLNLILLFITIWLGYSTVVSVRYTQKSRAVKNEVQYKKLLVGSIARSKSLPEIKRQVEYLQKLIKDAPDALFKQNELPKLIDDLSELALQSGLRVKVLNPQPVNRINSHVSFRISFACDGTFGQLSNFVNRLNSLRQIILIRSYQLIPYGQVGGQDILKANMTLETFSLSLDKKGGV